MPTLTKFDIVNDVESPTLYEAVLHAAEQLILNESDAQVYNAGEQKIYRDPVEG